MGLGTSERKYTASAENLSLAADAGDFFNLEGTASVAYEILEVRVFQRGTTTLTMDSILLRRGTITTPGGGALTEYEWESGGPAASIVARSLPTDDVASTDWEYRLGWNLLQEALWLPTPEMQIICRANQDFGITRATTTAYTGVGVCVTWREFAV